MPEVVTTETVADVLRRQVVVPEWLRNLLDGRPADEAVRVKRLVAPFGTYLLQVTPLQPAPAREPRVVVPPVVVHPGWED